MNIDLHDEITIRDIVENYVDNDEEGVYGYNSKLNIRPKYQREFIYKEKERDAVIDTVLKGFPLNVMYWVVNGEGDNVTYEVLDGQQRTISFCQYVCNDFSIKVDGLPKYFDNLVKPVQKKFLDYKLSVYFCEGDDKERLEWFETINIAGLKLTSQELKNAIYSGEWVTSAKRYFSKSNSPAHDIGGKYLTGEANRQAYLETAIKWIAAIEEKSIETYMSEHQHDKNANELWLYFQSVINWVDLTFPNYRKKEMKGLDWGIMFNKYGKNKYDIDKFESEILRLIDDDEVQKNSGIYEYLFDGDEKHLNLRTFDDKVKRATYERQKGICVHCNKIFEYEQMEADHIVPWSKGGKTIPENCQMLCAECNRRKGNR